MSFFHLGSVITEGPLEPSVDAKCEIKVRLEGSDTPTIVTDDVDRKLLINLPSKPFSSCIPLLYHLHTLVQKHGIEFKGHITSIAGRTATLHLDVFFPSWLLQPLHALKPSVASAQLFLNLIPLPEHSLPSHDPEPAEHRHLSFLDALKRGAGADTDTDGHHTDGSEVFSLRSCITTLPPKEHTVTLAELKCTSSSSTSTSTSTSHPLSLADLPLEAITHILNCLDSSSLQSLSQTCRYFSTLAGDVGPGLRLSLYPHQRNGIRWMLDRESAAARRDSIPHPTWRRFPIAAAAAEEEEEEVEEGGSGGGGGSVRDLWGDTAGGGSSLERPPSVFDFRGGLLCDEPGLGKTITVTGLMLRTQGTLPLPPSRNNSSDSGSGGNSGTEEGTGVVYFDIPKLSSSGNSSSARCRSVRCGYYTVLEEDCKSISKLERCSAKADSVRRSKRWRRQGEGEERGERGGRRRELFGRYKERDEHEEQKDSIANISAPLEIEKQVDNEEEEEVEIAAVDGSGTENAAKRQKNNENGRDDGGGFAIITPPPKSSRPRSLPSLTPSTAVNTTTTIAVGGLLSRLPVETIDRGDKETVDDDDDIDRTGTPSSPHNGGRNAGIGADNNDGAQQQQRPHVLEKDYIADDDGDIIMNGTAAPPAAPARQYYDDDSDEIDYSEDDDDAHFLQCSVCSKWRRIALHLHPPSGTPWCCYQHPHPSWRSCSIREEDLDEDEDVTSAPGWLLLEGVDASAPGAAKNIEFFRDLLTKYDDFLAVYNSCTDKYKGMKKWIEWIVKQEPTTFSTGGILISEKHTPPPGFGRLLAEIGFSSCHKSIATTAGGPPQRLLFAKNGALPPHQQDWRRWEQPLSHWKLTFDGAAFQQALHLGPSPRKHRIYLSPATLVVVPQGLLQHWKDQILLHTRPDSLRICVYDIKDNPLHDFHKKEEPAPHILAWEYDVVLTTFGKMSTGWDPKNPVGCSPLAKIHWLRIILDEGHTVGSTQMTNRFQMVTALRAERRWVMTGTPAPSTTAAGAITLKYMQPLLTFLHDEALGGVAFSEAIEKQLKDCPVASRWRLQLALRRCLIRATKADLIDLPPVKRSVVLLDFAPSHAESYNYFVDMIRLNLLSSDWFDWEHQESLLNKRPENAKRATQTLENLAQSCNVAGNAQLQVSASDLHDSLELLAAAHGYPPPLQLDVGSGNFCPGDHPLHRIEQGLLHGGHCDKCSAHVRTLIMAPCACLICIQCCSASKTHCLCCNTPYKMQSKDDPARRRDAQGVLNPNPKWDVPQELIEWQPAFAQRGAIGASGGYWQEDWKHTDSTKIGYLVNKLRELGALPHVGWNPAAWGESSSSSIDDGGAASKIWPPVSSSKPPRKAIVFTQFPIHGRLLINQLRAAAPALPTVCVAKYHRGMTPMEKGRALRMFHKNPCCGVLVLDESGALGLDLSFVQHVFIMEPILNTSLEEQVVSRANRMGAREQVCVEVLAMRGTLEVEILKKNGDVEDDGDDEGEGERSGGSGVNNVDNGRGGSGGNREEKKRHADEQLRNRNSFLMSLKSVREAAL